MRWEDGHESTISPGPDATVEHDDEAEPQAEWEAAKAALQARTAGWRRGITAGVGREAALAQQKLGVLALASGCSYPPMAANCSQISRWSAGGPPSRRPGGLG